MITLYHLDQSRSERITWLLEELALEYRLEVFLRQPDLYGPAVLKDAHALGRAPVIRDGNVVLAESGAIVEYLIARHGQGRLSVAPAAIATVQRPSHLRPPGRPGRSICRPARRSGQRAAGPGWSSAPPPAASILRRAGGTAPRTAPARPPAPGPATAHLAAAAPGAREGHGRAPASAICGPKAGPQAALWCPSRLR